MRVERGGTPAACRPAMRLALILLALGLVSPCPARASARRPPVRAAAGARAASATAAALRDKWRAALRVAGRTLQPGAVLYHQIRDPSHRARWRTALAGNDRQGVLRRWIGAGGYPGLWTVEESSGWYRQDIAGRPVEIRLKDGMVLYDAELPEHAATYEAWLAEDRTHGKSSNPFETALNAAGHSLADRAVGVHAPSHGKFYTDLGIAGVTWVDAQGRTCIVLLNADAIAEVRFPDDGPRAAGGASKPAPQAR